MARCICLFLALCLLGFVPEISAQEPGAYDFGSAIGLGSQPPEGPCILFPADLETGTRLTAVWVPTEGVNKPAEAVPIIVESRLSTRCYIPEGGTNESRSYSVRPAEGSLSPGLLYVVLNTPIENVALEGATASVDLDGEPPVEMLRACTGTESIHVSVWSGTPLKGTQRWRGLKYLRYSVVPTCTEADFQVSDR